MACWPCTVDRHSFFNLSIKGGLQARIQGLFYTYEHQHWRLTMFRLYALKNDTSRLCMKHATLSDRETADMVEAAWKAQGFIVNREEEEE